ncbi:PepSY domain-containing protein [Sphingomonas sp. 2R-10]|uniref:PepSY-associated TM helix domain-containing protein n=1 Tax=Sphingomonas sp. 2R-10 TaxID=3045148 RepID=UPI000F77F3AA|nr:PepSY domain-containing protein [Sphingomonas sp. 2R-10]MDJ0275519.1 PepSY domain-containing protein [Sphingomonas sp. 2R-10]
MNDPRLYRTIWRWHFYAGLIVAPFLLILSITGAIYLFKDELNDALMPGLQIVAPVAAPLAPSRMIAAAVAAVPGVPTRIDLPEAPDRPAKVWIDAASGEPRQVMVDPGSGRVLGSYVYTHTLVGFADVMHGSLTFGPWGDAVVELAACWALMLIASGLFLWWPRERRSLAGVLWPRLRARGRLFWRDLHAVTGMWSVALIAFLLVTGLPWAVVQGPLVRGVFTAMGIGNEAAGFDHVAPQSRPMGALGGMPWSQETMPMAASDPAHADHGGGATHAAMPDHAAVAGTDAIAVRARAAGITGGYRLYLPSGPTGIYTVLVSPRHPEGQRTLQFDRWSGRLIGQNGWSRYGIGAKAVELGVQIHMGRYFGLANQLLMLLPCIAIVLLVVSGVTMWWRRRPSGRLAAPPPVSGARLRGAITLLAVAGVMLPLFGASLLVLAVVDRVVARLGRPVAA